MKYCYEIANEVTKLFQLALLVPYLTTRCHLALLLENPSQFDDGEKKKLKLSRVHARLLGDSAPPLKKGENKKKEKSTGIFIDLVSLRDLSQRSHR